MSSGFRPGWSLAARSAAVVAGVALITAVMVALRGQVTLLNAGMVYLLFVVLVSATQGLWPGVIASIAVNLALNFFFVPPFYRLTVDEAANVVALAVFLLVATSTSTLFARARAREEAALRKERESALLYELSSVVIAGVGSRTTLANICHRARQTLRCESASILVSEPGGLRLVAADGISLDYQLVGDERALASEALRSGEPGFLGRRPGRMSPRLVGNASVPTPVAFVPLRADGQALGLLRVAGHLRDPFAGQDAQRLLTAFGQVAAQALHHARLMREVTASRALQEADVLKSALLSVVSHELRTPLGSIKASVTGLLDPGHHWSPAEQAEFLAAINEETDRLTRLVANLLDLSRIEGGALQPERDHYDVREFLETVVGRLQPMVPAHPISLSFASPTGEALFDYVQLAQVISNLVENAAKFSPAGTGIAVRAESDGRDLTIRVIDGGPGIPMEDRPRVFERFFRGASTAAVSGTGLGLTISKGLVQAHGGTITIEDVPGGQGAMMVVTLPVTARLREPVAASV